MQNHSKKRVVVTGIGIVSPVGLDREASWSAIKKGQSGVATITHFDATECACHIAAEVKNFEVSRKLDVPLYPRGKSGDPLIYAVSPKDAKRMDRFIHFALHAGIEAYQDAGLDACRDVDAKHYIPATDMGINIGVGMGGLPGIEDTHNTLRDKGFKRITPFFIPQVIPNLAAGQLSIALNTQNTNLCSVSACSSRRALDRRIVSHNSRWKSKNHDRGRCRSSYLWTRHWRICSHASLINA